MITEYDKGCYEKMKPFFKLPFRSCLKNINRHPSTSLFAVLDQLHSHYKDKPISKPIYFIHRKKPAAWWAYPGRDAYFVPLLTENHAQLLVVKYKDPTTIEVFPWCLIRVNRKEIQRILYEYLPWVRKIYVKEDLFDYGVRMIPTSLYRMCVPIMAYTIMSIDLKKDIFGEFLKLITKLTLMTDKQMYEEIMGTWQTIVRPN